MLIVPRHFPMEEPDIMEMNPIGRPPKHMARYQWVGYGILLQIVQCIVLRGVVPQSATSGHLIVTGPFHEDIYICKLIWTQSEFHRPIKCR